MKSDSLFELVHSLSQAERRYFQLYAGVHRENAQYLEVYNTIVKMKTWDEAAFQSNIDPVIRKRLPAHKNYLRNMVLKSLRSFYQDASIEMKLRGMVDEIEILMMRGLTSHAKKQLERLKKEAERNEMFPYLQMARRWERKLLKNAASKERKLVLDQLRKEEVHELKQMENEAHLRYLNDQMIIELQTRFVNPESPELRDFAHQMLRDTGTEDKEQTFEARLLVNFIHAFLNQFMGSHTGAHPYYARIIELWENHSLQMDHYPERYALSLVDYLNSFHHLGQYDEFPALISKLRDVKALERPTQLKIEGITSNLELIYFLNRGMLKEAGKLVEDWEVRMIQNNESSASVSPIAYWYNFAIVHFFCENFKRSLRWINEIVNEPANGRREDIRRFCFILRCLVHIELKNEDTVESLLNALNRNLGPTKQLPLFEKQVVRFISACLQSRFTRRETLFKNFLEELQEIEATTPVLPFGFSETQVWALSRAKRISVREALRVSNG